MTQFLLQTVRWLYRAAIITFWRWNNEIKLWRELNWHLPKRNRALYCTLAEVLSSLIKQSRVSRKWSIRERKFSIFLPPFVTLSLSRRLPRLFDRGWFSLGCNLRQSSTCNQFANTTGSSWSICYRLLHSNYTLRRNYTRYRSTRACIFDILVLFSIHRRLVTRRFNAEPHRVKTKPLNQSAYRKSVIG